MNNKVAIKILIPIVFLIILAISFLVITSNSFVASIIESQNKDRVEKQKKAFLNGLSLLQDRALEVASLYSINSQVVESYILAVDSNKTDFETKVLEEQFRQTNDVMEASGNRNFRVHFHTKDIYSFYRSWTKKRGDDLSGFRQTVKTCINESRFIKGIEVGRGGLVIRGIAPIKDGKGRVLGSVENYIDITRLIEMQDSKNNQKDELSIFLAAKMAKITDDKVSTNTKSKNAKVGQFKQVNKTSENFIEKNLTESILKT